MADDAQREPPLVLLTTVPSSAEAVIVVGELQGIGIRATPEPSARGGAIYGAPPPLDIFVEEPDLDRAREVLNAQPLSDEELLEAEEQAGDGDR